MSWFRNSTPQFSVPTETLQTTLLLTCFFPPHLAAGWRGEFQVQKVNITGEIRTIYEKQQWDKEINNNSNNTNNRVYEKEMSLLTKETLENRQYSTAPSAILPPPLPLAQNQCHPNHSNQHETRVTPPLGPPHLFDGKEALLPFPCTLSGYSVLPQVILNDMRWYRITWLSWSSTGYCIN